MQIGDFSITTYNFGSFRLDGGSMFGSVPKNLWSKRLKPDDENCITLATRSLVIQYKDRLILVDLGMGDKWGDKERSIYAISANPTPPPFKFEDVTDIVLTHLHFDHAGGISRKRNGQLERCYPNATVHLQRANLENAKSPNVKERASYLIDNYGVLEHGKLNLVEGSAEIFPGLFMHRIDGHTVGQSWIEIRAENSVLAFPTDMIPTSRHLPVPFHMGYDICASKLLVEKDAFLRRAVKERWIVVFEHDPDTEAATIKLDERGHFAVDTLVPLIASATTP